MSRYPPRERTPPRQFDRRASSTYTPLASTSSSSYRPANDPPPSQIDRPVPRGPRADSFRGASFPSSTFASRGRGATFASRPSDSWDRDRDRDRERDRDRDRDVRNTTSTFRREDDRSDWARRDDRAGLFNRDRPYAPRERSASPPRARRDSKENLGPTFGRQQDSPTNYFPANARGGASVRARGRGDWDRSRGRTSFVTERDRERDLFPNRSRSREGWRDRDFERGRSFAPDVDRVERFERREYDRPSERDTRNRDHDTWQRDLSPGRSSTGNRAPSPGAMSSISQDRPHKLDYDSSRKPPISASAAPSRDSRRETDTDYFASRTDSTRRDPPFAQPSTSSTVPQSSALGLDYGPPPSAPANPPSQPVVAAEKPAPAPRPSKQESAVTSSGFQPPSGPKAERTPSAPLVAQSSQGPLQSTDNRVKLDSTPRIQRQQLENTGNTLHDPSRPGSDQSSNRPMSTSVQIDRPLPPNVPSGPRITSGMPFKSRTSPVVQQMNLPLHGPTPPKPITADSRGTPNVPTGPRGAAVVAPLGPRASMPMGSTGVPSGQILPAWRRPPPAKPSIMNTMNRPHMAERPIPGSGGTQSRQSPKMNVTQPGATIRSPTLMKTSTALAALAESDNERAGTTPADTDMSAPVTDDDDMDEEPEEDDGLDEDYFDNSEKVHQREMELLKAKKSPLPLQDPSIVNKLIRIQLLGMIVEGLVPDAIKAVSDGSKDVEMQDRPTEGLISPQETPGGSGSPVLRHPKPRGRPLKEPPINPIPTPPVEDLPFLTKAMTEMSTFEEPAGDEIEVEAVIMLLRQHLEHEAWDQKGDLQELFEFYRLKYPEWRYEIDSFERARREIHEPTPDPGSPGGQSSVSIPPSAERPTGRTARNATEFDMEKAILMSQQSAREEEERREKAAASNAKPNYDSEALVPDMLAPSERASTWNFKDATRFAPIAQMVELMEYIPPEDDFTEEEQRRFTAAFCQTPKKWGFIADHVTSRSYHQCIAHYYLTKNEAHYKDIWRRSQPKRKRGRAATKPRSTALLSDMTLNEDNESTPVPVTDSGRPRRAAAPTFGDAPDADGAIAPPAAKRLAMGSKEGSDGTTPKATKGRKAGTATKIRRTKAQILADSQALAQAGLDGATAKGSSGRVRTLLRADNSNIKGDAMQPANLAKLGELDNHQYASMAPATTTPVRPEVTSYWSVPECQKFRQLVAYYGHDYAKIAEFMKTKSQAMIKNYYNREAGKGDTELEQLARIADEKISRGEPMGRPPSPIVPPKRKYDSAPTIQPQTRSLATAVEGSSADMDRTMLVAKQPLVEDFPPNSLHRDANGSVVAKPSARAEFLQTTQPPSNVQTKVEDHRGERQVLAQKTQPGPPRGHFVEDAVPFSQSPSQRLMQAPNEHSSRPHAPNVLDLRGGDLTATHPQSSPREALLQSRDHMGNSKHTSHNLHHQLMAADGSPGSQQLQRSLHNINLGVQQRMERDRSMISDLGRGVDADWRSNLAPGSIRSPRLQPMQVSQSQRHDPYTPTATVATPPVVKQEPPKPVPAKRSNLLALLNDDPPERPPKRLSTDTVPRSSIHTPPQQPSPIAPLSQMYQPRPQDDPSRSTPSMYASVNAPLGHASPHDVRSTFSNSPAPPRDWLDKFDPRPVNNADNATRSQSPHYTMVAPVQQNIQKTNEPLRSLEPSGGRRTHLGKSQISSPTRQSSTPLSQYRSTSTVPHHSRMSSLNQSQIQPSPDHRNAPQASHQAQQQPFQQSQHMQQASTAHPASTSGTPVSSLHSRSQPSMDFRRSTIQEFVAQRSLGPQEMSDHRMREEGLSRGGLDAQNRRGLHPQDQPRQSDPRDIYRNDGPPHQVPPPPSRTSQPQQMSHLPAFGNSLQRTYTPPLTNFSNDPRGMASMHNQQAHHHHHSVSMQQGLGQQSHVGGQVGPPSHTMQQQQQQQQQQAQQQHHPHQQGQLGQMSLQSHQGISQQQQQQGPPPPSQQQQQQQQQRYQGLGPPTHSHYRGYSQGGGERR